MNIQSKQRHKERPITHRTDDISSEPILEIQHGESWMVVARDIFESWTGLRRQNGAEFHGDVHPLHMPDRIWTGSRTCNCRTCQAHVEARHRPN